MSKCTSPSNKRAVPHERSVEGITKYFKPLNELINQLVPTSLSSSSSKASPSTTPTTPKTSSTTSTTPETSSSRTSTTAKTSSSRTPTTSRASSSRTSTTAKTSSKTPTTPKTSSRTSTTPETSSSRTPTTSRASSSKTPTTSRTSSSTTPTTYGTSKVQSIHVKDVPANNTSESLISVVNTSSLLDKISHLSMNSDKATLCNSFQNIAITSTDSISSNEPDKSLVFFESNADIQSSDDPEHNQIQHATPENSEINQRDMLATYLFQIEFHLKSCQNLIKDSTRNDISHKEFVEKTRSFVFELKTILDSLDTTCHEQIEKMNAQFSNVEFVCRKSNDAISRDLLYSLLLPRSYVDLILNRFDVANYFNSVLLAKPWYCDIVQYCSRLQTSIIDVDLPVDSRAIECKYSLVPLLILVSMSSKNIGRIYLCDLGFRQKVFQHLHCHLTTNHFLLYMIINL
ncbi:unnamed protein product [Rotaria sp. Silwood2]|nr:unnamed protein product [Rotaria sp. Silwood2]